MALATSEARIQLGIRRLLESPLSLASCGAVVWKPSPGLAGSERHRELFLEYKEEVDNVAEVALEFWEETLEARKGRSSDESKVVRDAWIDRPAGPASFPGLVALIRDYWLACHKLNQEVAEDERVPPWTFLLGWLAGGGGNEQ